MAEPRWTELHAAADRAGAHDYRDPETGYTVFTRSGLLHRGRCCGSGCRHCPFDRPAEGAARELGNPAWKRHRAAMGEAVDVLSWSGGKDSYLALLALQAEGARPVVLLTTHDADSGTIAHQELHIDAIGAQAKALGVDLLAVPLHPSVPYADRLQFALDMIRARHPIRRIVFGDLHLQHIRGWRESALHGWSQQHDAVLHFPLWHADPHELLKTLARSGARVTVCAAPVLEAYVGCRFDASFVARLPDDVDPFGENGEFHTYVEPAPR